MNLLTQEQGAELKVGQKVNEYTFTPRKPKGEERPSTEFEGRTVWADVVTKGLTVMGAPWKTVSDGWAVTLSNSSYPRLVWRLELAQ